MPYLLANYSNVSYTLYWKIAHLYSNFQIYFFGFKGVFVNILPKNILIFTRLTSLHVSRGIHCSCSKIYRLASLLYRSNEFVVYWIVILLTLLVHIYMNMCSVQVLSLFFTFYGLIKKCMYISLCSILCVVFKSSFLILNLTYF